MNTHQAPVVEKMEVRRLPATELRPGALVTLAKSSPESATLPSTAGQCVGGSYARVVSVSPYGSGMLKVTTDHARAPHPTKCQIFVVAAAQRVLVRMPETKPVPHTPLAWAKLMGIPAALAL